MVRTGRGRRMVPTLALVVLPLLAAGCGGGSEDTATVEPGAPGGGTGTGEAVDPQGASELTIVVDDGSGKKTTWQLTCDPAGGTHPDPAAACKALTDNGATALAPVPKDQMCTQIFGGPETAQITGTWQGKPVTSTLSKKNGCEIGRWKALAGLLPGAPTGT